MWLSEQSLELVSGFKEASRKFHFHKVDRIFKNPAAQIKKEALI